MKHSAKDNISVGQKSSKKCFLSIVTLSSSLFCFSRINHIIKNPRNVETDAACKPINLIKAIFTAALISAPYILVKLAFFVFLSLRYPTP